MIGRLTQRAVDVLRAAADAERYVATNHSPLTTFELPNSLHLPVLAAT